MMKAYNPDWLDALEIKKMAGQWRKRGWIPEDQYEKINQGHPAPFYTPNVFVRIGLFLFTCFLTLCAVGLASLVFSSVLDSGQEVAAGVLSILYGGGTLMALEYFISTKHHYRSGIDDALLYFTLILFIGGISLIVSAIFKEDPIGYFILAFPFLLFAGIRYADRLVAVLTCSCLLGIAGIFCIQYSWGRLLVPFVIMLLSGLLYYYTYAQRNRAERRYWAKCFLVLEFLLLLTFYLSGNYWVVREGNAVLNEAGTYREFVNPEIDSLEKRRNQIDNEITHLREENEAYRNDTLNLTENQLRAADNDAKIEELYLQMSNLYDQISAIRSAEKERIEAEGVPFAWLFYGFTFLIPLLYLIFALRRRDRVMLWAGMLTAVLAVFSYKYYHHVLPTETAVTLAGALLLALAYLSIRLLKQPGAAARYGLTYLNEEEVSKEGPLNAEALLVSEGLGHSVQQPQPEPGFEFGGGDFGGGGAGSKY
jgi:hypothetical protein